MHIYTELKPKPKHLAQRCGDDYALFCAKTKGKNNHLVSKTKPFLFFGTLP